MEKETMWNILIENELYILLKVTKNNKEKEKYIKEFSNEYKIPMSFIKAKIEQMNKSKSNINQEENER